MSSAGIVTKISALLAPILADLSLELYDCEFAGGNLKVSIDTPAGQENGVDLDQIALVTRLLGRELDHDDFIPGKYVLEVTSPGLERTLRTPAHFEREIGKTINVRLVALHNGRRRAQGVLVASTQDSFTVRIEETADGAVSDQIEEVVIPLHLVEKARTVFVWGTNPKPNSPAARAARKSGSKSQSSTIKEVEVSAL